jgi:hypothetical protein
MKTQTFCLRWMAPVLALATLAALLGLSGCVQDDDFSKAVTQFQSSSAALTQAFQALMTNANLIEEDNYIDTQTFEGGKIVEADMKNADVLTDDEIKLRAAAIKALADYTTALATLATRKPPSAVEASAKTASTSMNTLASKTQTSTAAAPATGPKMATPTGPISSAVNAAGAVLELIEKHKSEKEVKESLAKNDPQVTALFDLMASESRDIYTRQKTTLDGTGTFLFVDYNKLIGKPGPDPTELLQLSDRIKQYEKDSVALKSSDPMQAIAGFQKAHDALVKAMLASGPEKKKTAANAVAAVKSFATDVTPLGQALQSLAKSVM